MRTDLARALASGFLAGEWTQGGLVQSGTSVLGHRRRWLAPLVRQTLELYPRPPHDRPRELATVVATRPAAERAAGARPVVHPVVGTRMVSNRWRLPVLADLDDVARFVGVTTSELGWFADPGRWARTTAAAPLQHYRVGHRVAASGAIRVLEAPKRQLKGIQRLLLDEIGSLVPPHDAARGFRPGGSVRSYAARTPAVRSCCDSTWSRSSPASPSPASTASGGRPATPSPSRTAWPG